MVKEMEIIELEASPRAELGSNAVNRLRRAGWLPAVVYDVHGKARPVKFNRHAFELMVRRHGGQNLIMDMRVDGGNAVKVLLKEVQRDSIRDNMLHVDLLEVSMTRKLRLAVSVHLIGEPPGVITQGGILEQLVRSVEIECLPSDIVQELTLDVSALNVGDSLFVRDLRPPATITVLTAGHIAVAAVHVPTVEEEVKPEEAAEGAAAEGAPGAKPAEGAAADKAGKDEKAPAGDKDKGGDKDKKEKK